MCFISVIVPVYNSEKTLNRCIDSILSQTFSDFELIIVDDGSTDSSSKICNNYAEQDVRVKVFHKPNGGVSSARNLGLENVSGKWVTFCDSDDYVDSDWLEIFVNAYRKDVKLIVQSVNYIGCTVNNRMTDYFGNVKGYIESYYNNSCIGYIYNKLYYLQIIKKYNLGFIENLKYREDLVFMYQYIMHIDNVICVSKSGYNYVAYNYYNKYNKAENFSPSYIIYQVIKKNYKEVTLTKECYNYYINDLYHSLFDSFIKKNKESFNMLKNFNDVIDSEERLILPFYIRWALNIDIKMAYLLLKFMALIRRNL